jgi:hypothetical protein
MDIGLTEGDIDYIVAHRAIERLRDGTTYPWLLPGVMSLMASHRQFCASYRQIVGRISQA